MIQLILKRLKRVRAAFVTARKYPRYLWRARDRTVREPANSYLVNEHLQSCIARNGLIELKLLIKNRLVLSEIGKRIGNVDQKNSNRVLKKNFKKLKSNINVNSNVKNSSYESYNLKIL